MEKGWKEVFMTDLEYKAHMAKDLLANAGIQSVIMNQHDTAYQAFGDFLVYTSEKDAERAAALIKKLKGE